MPRKRRIDVPGATHHVVAQGNNRQVIFLQDHDRELFLERAAGVAASCHWDLHAYCLLDTHVHLLLRTRDGNLGAGMGQLLGWYAHRFNHTHGREGHLFRRPFWSRIVEDGEQHLRACFYIALNPVAAGLCRLPRQHPWQRITDVGIASHDEDVVVGRDRIESALDAVAERIRTGREPNWRTAAQRQAELLARP